jgi:tetratricopeptide (TPR) repeat protein
MTRKEKPKIFLSYAREDIEIIREFYNELVKNDHNVWWDKTCRDEEVELENDIAKQVVECRIFLLCLSENSRRKLQEKDEGGFVRHELNLANDIALKRKDLDFIIIPVFLDEIPYPEKSISNAFALNLTEGINVSVSKLNAYISDIETKSVKSKKELASHSLLSKAFSAAQSGKMEMTTRLLRKLLKLDPGHFDGLVLSGFLLNYQEKYSEALIHFNRALEINPDSYEALVDKSYSLMKLERFEESMVTADLAILKMDSAHDAYVNKCLAMIGMGLLDEARDMLDQEALPKMKYNHGKSRILNARGFLALQTEIEGLLPGAIDDFQEAHKLDEDFDEPIKNLEIVYEHIRRKQHGVDYYFDEMYG